MLCVSIAYGNGGGLSSYLGGVKASTPAARSLLDPRLRSRRSCPQVGAEEWSFSLTKEYFRKDAFGTFGEGAARGPIKFRDQKPLKTPRFACPGSQGSVDICTDDVVFTDGEQTSVQLPSLPPPDANPDLAAELAHDAAFVADLHEL